MDFSSNNSNRIVAAAPIEGKKRHPLKAILAGGISGGIEIMITYPTEFVKTMVQLDKSTTSKPKFTGPIDCAKQTIKQYGVSGLYRGLSILLYTSIPKASVRFSAYEFFKNHLADDNNKLTTGRTLLAGLGAGVSEAIFVVAAAETIKIKMIDDLRSPTPRFRGFFHGVRCIIAEEGFRGIYKGIMPTIAKQGSNQAVRFVVYNNLKEFMQGGDSTKKLTPLHTAAAGAVAGAASVYGNTPIDVIKSRMQGLEAHKYKNSFDAAQQLVRNEGWLAFYKGTTPRLGRVCLDVALVMTLYEQIMNLLDYAWKTE